MSGNIALLIAHKRVHAYADESDELMRRHAEAMECRDCEDFLAKGIEAFKWLRTAEDTMREGDYQGVFEFTPELQKVLDVLYSAWLVPCDFVETWNSCLAARGYTPENLNRFRESREEAEYIVQHRNWQNKATGTRILASAEESW